MAVGFRFRKTVRLGGLVRLNFSGSGVSLGLGPRGANVNISSRGVRKTVGLPGTGLSYQIFTKWTKPPPAPPPVPQRTYEALPQPHNANRTYEEAAPPVAPEGERQGTGFLKFLGALALLMFLAAVLGLGRGTPQLPAALPAAGPVAQSSPAPASATLKPPEQAAAPAAKPAPPPPTASNAAPLTMDEVRELQTWLKAFGLDPGPIDGFMGPLTTVAIKKYEAARLQPVTGTADRPLLERLRRDTSGPIR